MDGPWKTGTCPSHHTRAASPDRQAFPGRRTERRNAGFAPEPAASSRQGRRTPCACLLRRMPEISASMAATGSSRQDTDHPRQGISINRGVHTHPEPVRPGSAKPKETQRFKRDDVIWEPICGIHQGQQPYCAAETGRTHECTRPVLIATQKALAQYGSSTHGPTTAATLRSHACAGASTTARQTRHLPHASLSFPIAQFCRYSTAV